MINLKDNYNSPFKLNPIFNIFQHVFGTILTSRTMFAVDKMMIVLKRRHKINGYMPPKILDYQDVYDYRIVTRMEQVGLLKTRLCD